MSKSDDVQDERYIAMTRLKKSDDICVGKIIACIDVAISYRQLNVRRLGL